MGKTTLDATEAHKSFFHEHRVRTNSALNGQEPFTTPLLDDYRKMLINEDLATSALLLEDPSGTREYSKGFRHP